MTQTIVMLHGAHCGAWCFDVFREVLESAGYACLAPDLVGHGADRAEAKTKLEGVGLIDYRAQMEAFVEALPDQPILIGHSMGAIIAQQLASSGFAQKLVLLSPASHAGVPICSDAEKRTCRDFMATGPFWTRVLTPNLEIACQYSLNGLSPRQQKRVFEQFGPESGQALFEMFFRMIDLAGAAVVDTGAVRCPVLCLSGAEDRVVSLAAAETTAASYSGSTFWRLDDHAHMPLLEDGAEDIAARIVAWLD